MKLKRPYFVVYKDPRRHANPVECCPPDTDLYHQLHVTDEEQAVLAFAAFVRNFGNHGEYGFRLLNLNAMDESSTLIRSLRAKDFEAIDHTKPKIPKAELKVNVCDRCYRNIGQYPLFVQKQAGGDELICQACVFEAGGKIPAMDDDGQFTFANPRPTPKPPYRRS